MNMIWWRGFQSFSLSCKFFPVLESVSYKNIWHLYFQFDSFDDLLTSRSIIYSSVRGGMRFIWLVCWEKRFTVIRHLRSGVDRGDGCGIRSLLTMHHALKENSKFKIKMLHRIVFLGREKLLQLIMKEKNTRERKEWEENCAPVQCCQCQEIKWLKIIF